MSRFGRIPFFEVQAGGDPDRLSPESLLAREMGRPPWPVETVSGSVNARRFFRSRDEKAVGMIFDPEFWYGPGCWKRWMDALREDGTEQRINVPLGNQDPGWRSGLRVPGYVTLKGIEDAARFVAPERWMFREAARPDVFCVCVAPVSTGEAVPKNLLLEELPDFWSGRRTVIRVFCEGWLHSFGALKEEGRRHDLLAMCSWQGTILELGCDTGLMAKTCKEMGLPVRWVGVDVNPDALLRARPHLDMAVRADLARSLPLSAAMKFDRIVCGDFLEHLPYPWDLLVGLRSRIKPDGLLVLSFPNVGHWAVVEALLSGRWDEAPSGIQCVSHLRFGTRKSLERWLQKTGWETVKWDEETFPVPEQWVLPREELKRSHDLRSLETVRFRLLARPV